MSFPVEFCLKESCRKKCYFFVCFIACFLVSFVCLVAKTLVSQGSFLFLSISEKEVGEIDFILSPLVKTRNSSLFRIDDFHKDYAFINFTEYEEIMKEGESIKQDIKNPFYNSVIRSYFKGYSPYNELELILIDTEREKKIELGRAYPYNKLKPGQCLVHKNLAIFKEKTLNISLSMNDFITNTLLYYYYDIKNKNESHPGLIHLPEFENYVQFTCDIVDTFNDNFGKEREIDNLVIMEQEYFYKYISKFIPKYILEFFPDYPNIVKQIKAQDYGNALIVNFPKNRLDFYRGDNYDDLLERGVKYMNKVVKKLGTLQNYNVNMPLINKMNRYKYGTTMLNLILNLILLGIFGLSLILIHSLLLITTETHSFEFGILRIVGNSKKNIILIIILECITFSIPAFIFALIVSYFAVHQINEIIKEEISTDLNIYITKTGFVIALILNFLGPIISAIFPIRNILRKNIASSINTILSKTQGMKIEIISLKNKELSSMVIFGLITFIYGASIYYFLPLSMLSLNFGMMGAIFLWILCGILLGFALLSRNIETFFQKFLTNTLLFFFKNHIKILILKNLSAHKLKNKKTSLMFTLSVGIFIMTSVGFDLISKSTKNMIILYSGSEIVLYNKIDYFTPKEVVKPLMELYNKNLIESFSFFTQYLDEVCLNSDFYISNYGKTINSEQYILAVNSAYFDSISNNNLKISEMNRKYKKYSPSEQLYFSEFKGKVGVSGLLKYLFNANLDSKIFLQFFNKNQEMEFLSQPGFILNSAGGLSMNNQPNDYETRETIISIPFYLDILQKCRNYFSESFGDFSIISYDNLPIFGINIKPKKITSEEDIDSINSALRIIGPNADLWFFASLKKSINSMSNIVFLIFYSASSVVLFFCLFNLAASMVINISDQKKEIATFRALGINKIDTILIFIGESFILILSSSFIGCIIGSIISYTIVLQWTLFTNVNVLFNLPTGSIILISFFSILGGIFATYFPIKKILNISISDLIKSS